MATATEEKPVDDAEQCEAAAADGQVQEAEETAASEPSEEAALLAEIVEQQDRIDQAKRLMDGLKEDLKEAREEWESLVEEQARIIRRQHEKYPLFDRKKEESAPEPDAWRAASIDELRLPSGIDSKLREAGIETIGQIEDKRAEGGDIEGAGLRSVPGIGPAKVDKIEEAVLAWLSANRDGWGQVEVSPNWRGTPVSSVNIPYPIQTALNEAGIGTLGALHDYVEEHGQLGLANVKDMGSERAESLMDKVRAYREAHPELFPEGEEATA